MEYSTSLLKQTHQCPGFSQQVRMTFLPPISDCELRLIGCLIRAVGQSHTTSLFLEVVRSVRKLENLMCEMCRVQHRGIVLQGLGWTRKLSDMELKFLSSFLHSSGSYLGGALVKEVLDSARRKMSSSN